MITFLVCLSGVVASGFLVLGALLAFSRKTVSTVSLSEKVETPQWVSPRCLSYFTQSSHSQQDAATLAGQSVSGLSKVQAEEFLDWLENQPECPQYELSCEDDTFTIHFQNTP